MKDTKNSNSSRKACSNISGYFKQKQGTSFKVKSCAANIILHKTKAICADMSFRPHNILLSEYLNEWLATYVQTNLSRTSFGSYEISICKYINKLLGNIPLRKLTADNIQKFYQNLKERGNLRSGGGLSLKTILHTHKILSEALKHAVQLKLIDENPTKFISVSVFKAEKYEATILKEYQIRNMLNKLKNEDIYIGILLAAKVGLTRGEVLGLVWDNVLFKEKALSIRQNVVYDNKQVIISNLRSKNNFRTITISDDIVGALKEQKEKQLISRQKLGEQYVESNYVCTRYNGDNYHPTSFSKVFARALKKYDIQHVRFHDLRHTYAMTMLQNGMPIDMLSKNLGHSTSATTSNLYT